MNNHNYVSVACTLQKQTPLSAESWEDLITSYTAIAQQPVIIFFVAGKSHKHSSKLVIMNLFLRSVFLEHGKLWSWLPPVAMLVYI